MSKQIAVFVDGRKRAVYRIDEADVFIGRSSDCHIHLVGNDLVHHLHAMVLPDGAGHLLRDLGGANGTFVNGKRVRGAEALIPGDEIQIGIHLLEYNHATDEARPLPKPTEWTDPDETRIGSEDELARARETHRLLARAHFVRGDERIVLDTYRCEIGYTEACKIRLEGSKWLGKVAAVLEQEGADWFCEPQSMFTLVTRNGEAMAGRTKLDDGDVIEVGGVSLTFRGAATG